MRRKRILILSSFGGYGHIAAASTLCKLLQEEYEIDIIYPIKELRIWGIPSGESFYNFLISNNFIRLINWIVPIIACPLFLHREQKTQRIIEKHIQEKSPDLVISLIPFINFPASEAASKMGIPFLLVSTDNDMQNWVYALEKCHPVFSNFQVTIGYDLPTTKGLLLKYGIPEKAIKVLGLPLRPEFALPQNKAALQKKYEIPLNKPVVLITMGGVGAKSSYDYAKVILQTRFNLHLIVCTGKNKRLVKKLKKIKIAQGNSLDIIPFTENIHEVFSLADLIITKPGPGSINEILALKIPMLIDHIGVPLFWEKANIDLITARNLGMCVKSFEQLPELIRRFLFDEQYREKMQHAYQNLGQNQFSLHIKSLIGELCNQDLLGEISVSARVHSLP